MELLAALKTATDFGLTVSFSKWFNGQMKIKVDQNRTNSKLEHLLDADAPQHIVASILIEIVKEFKHM